MAPRSETACSRRPRRLTRVKWTVQKDHCSLLAWRMGASKVPTARGQVKTTQDGIVVAAYLSVGPIVSAPTWPSTGEQTNIIGRNTDRPWNERPVHSCRLVEKPVDRQLTTTPCRKWACTAAFSYEPLAQRCADPKHPMHLASTVKTVTSTSPTKRLLAR